MSLLDSITGGIADQLKDQAGEQGNLINAAMQLMNSPEIGGPNGLAQSLAKQGQGETVTSWMSSRSAGGWGAWRVARILPSAGRSVEPAT